MPCGRRCPEHHAGDLGVPGVNTPGTPRSRYRQEFILVTLSSVMQPIRHAERTTSSYVMPNAFIAAVMGSEK